MADKNFSYILSTPKDRPSGLFFFTVRVWDKINSPAAATFYGSLVLNSECGRGPTAAPSVKRTECRRSKPTGPDPRHGPRTRNSRGTDQNRATAAARTRTAPFYVIRRHNLCRLMSIYFVLCYLFNITRPRTRNSRGTDRVGSVREPRFLLRVPRLSGHNLTAKNLKNRPKIRATVPVLNSYKGHVSHKYLLII
jgi:hypothetical protein